MKPLNNAERKAYRLRFIGIYSISVILIVVVLCGFLQPAPAVKTIMVEKEKPARVITKTVYLPHKNAAANNFSERDSLKAAISFNQKKVDELDSCVQSQKNIIAELQKQSAKAKSMVNNVPNKNEVTKLNKQIQFLDWALRSQVAVTNTLTKENNNLKDKIVRLNKSNE